MSRRGLWICLGLLASACTGLEPTRELAADGGGGGTRGSAASDAGGKQHDGGDGGGVGHGGTGSHDAGNDGAQPAPDGGGEGGGSGSGGSSAATDGGAGHDGELDAGDDGGPVPTGRCVGDGEMVDIPANTFLRGDESLVWSGPEGLVSVDDDFAIDRTEVTVIAYADCVKDGDCTAPVNTGYCNYGLADRDCYPVGCVTWEQATAYCAWAHKRLPTETEWELAARGKDSRKYPWAGSDGPEVPGHARWNADDGPVEVGSFMLGKTPEGALDMAGNVWEWTSSEWCDSYDTGSATCDPARHVDRGGGWETLEEQFMRSAFREADLENSNDQFGFRCAK